jgi:hypothetical protein
MSFEVHREPMYRRYYSTYTSAAFCYSILYGVTLVLCPLFLAYNSAGFWYKEGTYFEQPAVSYRYQTVIELSGKTTISGTSTPLSLFYSTSPSLNMLHSGMLRSPLLQSAEFDDNLDGVNDRIELNVQMPLQPSESITGMTAMLM